MKVYLINPPRLLTLGALSTPIVPPLGLAYIAGALQSAGHEVHVIDAIALGTQIFTEFQDDIILNGKHDSEIIRMIDSDVDVIGVCAMFSINWLAHRRLINALTQQFPNTKVIIGGEHATAVPQLCMDQCPDLFASVLGEGEETIVELLAALQGTTSMNEVNGIVYRKENGTIVSTGRRQRKRELEELPWPAWDCFPMEEYLDNNISYGVYRGRSLPIMATRGCPYTCTFCSSPAMWGTRYYMRSAKDMADEIEFLHKKYDAVNFDFFDLTAIINRHWIIEFCQELERRELNITWQIPRGTRSEVIDEEVAGWLFRSGCRNITYAPESGSPEVLKMIKKKVHLDRMLESIKASNKEQLNIKLNMIIGFPDERHSHVWETVWFMIRASWAGAHDALPIIFNPYPGSELFERLVVEKKIDISKDEYWVKLINADDYVKGISHCNHLGKWMLITYVIIETLAFYSSNYLFRPQRLFYSIKNLMTRKYESRGERALAEVVRRNVQVVVRKERELELISG